MKKLLITLLTLGAGYSFASYNISLSFNDAATKLPVTIDSSSSLAVNSGSDMAAPVTSYSVQKGSMSFAINQPISIGQPGAAPYDDLDTYFTALTGNNGYFASMYLMGNLSTTAILDVYMLLNLNISENNNQYTCNNIPVAQLSYGAAASQHTILLFTNTYGVYNTTYMYAASASGNYTAKIQCEDQNESPVIFEVAGNGSNFPNAQFGLTQIP
jgi:hypothetical protein